MTITKDNIKRAIRWLGWDIHDFGDEHILTDKGKRVGDEFYRLQYFRPHEDLNDMRLIEDEIQNEQAKLNNRVDWEDYTRHLRRIVGIPDNEHSLASEYVISTAKSSERFNAFIAMLDEMEGR